MARDTVSVDQIVNDFMLTLDGDDYVNNTNGMLIRNYALRGIREMSFDIQRKIKSLKLSVNTANDTVELPDDYVDYTKIGIIGGDGLIYVFAENKNQAAPMKYKTDSAGNNIDSNSDGVFDRVDAKGDSGSRASLSDYESYTFRNFLYEGNVGRAYGIGGGKYSGEFRINNEQNRIELFSTAGYSEIIIEYIADEARSTNPSIHLYAENALRSYIYYRLIERKANVPMGEKMRARQEYYNERRLANARLKSFTKEEALKTIRKNFKQSPKG
jgi:hypothetical protein|tara:strand:- start:20884 stop:21696 length:813 start_codon:yes stop_codon:yes gene_type:complete